METHTASYLMKKSYVFKVHTRIILGSWWRHGCKVTSWIRRIVRKQKLSELARLSIIRYGCYSTQMNSSVHIRRQQQMLRLCALEWLYTYSIGLPSIYSAQFNESLICQYFLSILNCFLVWADYLSRVCQCDICCPFETFEPTCTYVPSFKFQCEILYCCLKKNIHFFAYWVHTLIIGLLVGPID